MKMEDSLTVKPPGDDEESQMNLLLLEKEALGSMLVPSFFATTFAFETAFGILLLQNFGGLKLWIW